VLLKLALGAGYLSIDQMMPGLEMFSQDVSVPGVVKNVTAATFIHLHLDRASCAVHCKHIIVISLTTYCFSISLVLQVEALLVNYFRYAVDMCTCLQQLFFDLDLAPTGRHITT
jgi:hypothetical protein